MDAVVVHSEHGARRLREELGVDADRVRVIPHGAFDYLTRLPKEEPLPPELAGVEGPVILFFGLLRPYKGLDVLLDAFRAVDGAELWIAGNPRMPLAPLEEAARRADGTVRFVPRFVRDAEIPALMRRANVVVLPYREIDQSGVLYAALPFGKPLVLSDVGGFTEVAEQHGAAALVPPGDPAALAAELNRLLGDDAERARLGAAAARAAEGAFGWDTVAEQTLALYRELLDRS
jgi:glycosyltransferase involved in cell wall biosynthesis